MMRTAPPTRGTAMSTLLRGSTSRDPARKAAVASDAKPAATSGGARFAPVRSSESATPAVAARKPRNSAPNWSCAAAGDMGRPGVRWRGGPSVPPEPSRTRTRGRYAR